MLNTNFILLGAVVLVTFLFTMLAQKSYKAQAVPLTADELKTFNERFRFKRNRADMPTKFQTICAASDRLRRTSILGCLAVLAGIALYIIMGPTR